MSEGSGPVDEQTSRPGHYGLALILDETGQDYWQRVIQYTGFQTEWPAHISLFGAGKLADNFETRCKKLVGSCQNIELCFEALGHFLSPENVYYLAATPTLSLLNIHKQAYELFSDCDIFPYYQPNIWVPHCTIALPGDLNMMAKWLFQKPAHLKCYASELWLVDTTAKKVLYKSPLSKVEQPHG